MLRRLLSLPLFLIASGAIAQQLPPDQAAIKSHVQFLASDALRGREAGTRDFDVAAEYVASQMIAAGLKPAGDAKGSTWFQPVQLVNYRPGEKGSMTLKHGAATIPMKFGVDFYNEPTPSTPVFKVSGPVVFAGYGIVYPEGKRDDYKGLDVRGKIVAILPGVPSGLPTEVGAHLGDDGNKARFAEARGAKGVIVLESMARRESYTFEDIAPYYDYPRNGWAAPDGVAYSPAPNAPVIAYVSQAGAEKLFTGAKLKWAAVLAAEKKGARLPTGALAVSLDLASKTRMRSATSHNVVGVLEGSDPKLKSQYLILSAHLDHVGVGEPVNGDRIYNGAMDNAVGVAMILEVAKRFRDSSQRPKRSILFVALTAEEEGLIGSDFFAHYPPVPKASLVADLNIDMPILTYKVEDLVVNGEERMSLGPVIRAAAAAEGWAVVPDPAPEEMFFVRSDHYSFVQSGIPAVSIDTGPGGAGAAAQKLVLAENYHKPSDQIDLPWDWPSAAKYLRVSYAVARTLADAPERPRWNKGDFFGLLYKGYGAR
jgi:hypothetical protein